MTNVYYFGPLNEAGHYLHDQSHRVIWPDRIGPWRVGELDGGLCPNVSPDAVWKRTGPEIEGDAILHHKDGWTALAFWDRTIDTRGACCSVYLADGSFSFEEMVALAQDAFKTRWDRMKFKVQLHSTSDSSKGAK